MNSLLSLVIVTCTLAWFSHIFSGYDNQLGDYAKREKLFYFAMCIFIIEFAGLRYIYNDTYQYIHAYELITPPDSIIDAVKSSFTLKLGQNPGFNIINSILVYFGVSSQNFIMFYTVITLSIYFWFIHKYSTNYFLSIYLFYCIGLFAFSVAAIKQCFAVAICLVAIDLSFKNKHFWFVLLVVAAAFIHPYSLMFLLVPFLKFEPWSKNTYRQLLIFGVVGILLQFLVRTFIGITASFLGREYSAEDMIGEGVNIFRFGVSAVPLLLSFLVFTKINHKVYDERENLFINLSILYSELMFIALFGTANYFARLAYYFIFFQAISLPLLFRHLDKKYRNILLGVAVILYGVFFHYAYWVNESFDGYYQRYTLIEYLENEYNIIW